MLKRQSGAALEAVSSLSIGGEYMLKRQSGAALVVALMITIVMGILAVGISKVATTGQRRENASFGNAVSQANAVAAIKTAIGFTIAAVGTPGENKTYDGALFKPNSTSVTSKNTEFHLSSGDGVSATVRLNDDVMQHIYQGVEPELNGNDLTYSQDPDDLRLWYRNANNWTPNAQNSIVQVSPNDNSIMYRIDERPNAFLPINPGMNSSANNLGYHFYRVTSRGEDVNTGAVTYLQTHFGLLMEKN